MYLLDNNIYLSDDIIHLLDNKIYFLIEKKIRKMVLTIFKPRGGGNSYRKVDTNVPRWRFGHHQGIKKETEKWDQ